jgi:hypothetical protein
MNGLTYIGSNERPLPLYGSRYFIGRQALFIRRASLFYAMVGGTKYWKNDKLNTGT